MKLRYVKQQHPMGCAVACIAMVANQTYDEVERCFQEDFNRQTLKHEDAQTYLMDHGFAVIEKRTRGYVDVRVSNKRMAVPFAPVHIVTVMPYISAKHAHSIVMDAKGRIYDPQHPEFKDLTPYYEILTVAGYYYEGAKRKSHR